MNVTSFTWIGNGLYFKSMKAFRLQYLTICPSLVWLILVQWSGTYTHLDGIIFGICFFARQNNIDDTECLPNDPEVCNYLKEFISEFTEEFLCHLAWNVT